MKFFAPLITTYLVVVAYFVYLNASTLRWLPIIFAYVIICAFLIDAQSSIFVAFVSGLFLDLHFLYVGVYALVFVACVLTVHWLLENRFTSHSIQSYVWVAVIVSLEFSILQFGSYVSLGYATYLHTTGTLLTLVSGSVASSLLIMTLFGLWKLISALVKRYAR